MTENQGVREHAKTKWNDIRRVGPLLIVALAAVVMVNPSFVTDTNSVGGAGIEQPCDSPPIVWSDSGDLANIVDDGLCEPPYDPCYDGPIVWATSGNLQDNCCLEQGLGELPSGECCVPVAMIGSFMDCPSPTTVPEPDTGTDGDGAEGEDEEEEEDEPAAPAKRLPPPPAPIIGPIWLGAIQVDASVPGLVTLTFPDLLGAFIEDNDIRVYDADGLKVFEGQLGADGTITVLSDNAPMLVYTTLTTRARYYETVGVSTTS